MCDRQHGRLQSITRETVTILELITRNEFLNAEAHRAASAAAAIKSSFCTGYTDHNRAVVLGLGISPSVLYRR